jgi:hypothetical protein
MKPWKRQGWVIPPEANGNFVAAMEQVLDVYKRPYDPSFPVVCMDETPRQLIKELFRAHEVAWSAMTTSTNGAGSIPCSWRANRLQAEGSSRRPNGRPSATGLNS